MRLRLRCVASAGARCHTIETLTVVEKFKGHRVVAVAAGKRAKHKRRKRTVVVGRLRVRILAGHRKRITILLNARGRRLLKRFGKLPVNLTIKLKANGHTRVVIKRKLTIKYHHKHKHHKHKHHKHKHHKK